jgi:FkbM family methyltransferase
MLRAVTKLAKTVRGSRGARYEAAFSDALLGAVRDGDVVWDVGANLGHYVEAMLAKAGARGHIVAFEPSRECFGALTVRYGADSRVKCENLALGARSGSAQLLVADDRLGATHRILRDPLAETVADARVDAVGVISGDEYSKRTQPPPNVIKIDTEGAELDVLRGMGQLLGAPSLRDVFVEVHFGILEERGERFAPLEIERLLQANAFSVRWLDPSHLWASRRGGS